MPAHFVTVFLRGIVPLHLHGMFIKLVDRRKKARGHLSEGRLKDKKERDIFALQSISLF